MYSRPRLASIEGVSQMAMPEGPYIFAPVESVLRNFGLSKKYFCHTRLPVPASYAMIEPLKVQQSYFSPATPSSSEETGTYRRFCVKARGAGGGGRWWGAGESRA